MAGGSLPEDELAQVDAVGLAALIRDGQLSPVEAVQATIDRIEHLDGEINAVIHRQFDQALALAASPDLPDGPFRGVPMLIKDLWATEAGQPHHGGVQALKDAGFTADEDTNLVTRYKEAGFVIVGRTNTPELGLAANASDGGGSIRIPAARCGLVGLKPSRGRVSQGPREEWSLSCQHVVCHTMRDTATILDACAIPFPGDGVVAPDHGRPYAERVGTDPGRLRIGLMADNHRVPTHADCEGATRRTADLLSDLGHQVVESRPEAFTQLSQMNDLAWAFTVHWSTGAVVSLMTLGEQLGREVTAVDVEPGTWFLAERGRDWTAPDYLRAQGIIGRWRRSMAAWWEDFDLLLTPTTALPPPRLGELTPSDDDPGRGSRASIPYSLFTSPFNTSGQPAISLPLGSSDGLPVGVQLVAAYGREERLMSVGGQLERTVEWSADRAPIHA